MMRRSILLCTTLLAAALGTQLAATGSTSTWSVVQHLKDPRIDESSGLATSSYFSSVLYTHNDSGDGARFFAVNGDGVTKAVYTLVGARSWDWEDMSTGSSRTLWLGDIGDNFQRKSSICVFRVVEPSTLGSASLPWVRYDFHYGDGHAHNAEALLVNPVTGRLFVATKQKSGAAIYRAPKTLKTSGYNTLSRVAKVPALVTGGAFSPNGSRFVLRTHSKAYLYPRVGATPTVVNLPSQKQGEAVAFTRDGQDLLVGSEGSDSPVWRVVLPTS